MGAVGNQGETLVTLGEQLSEIERRIVELVATLVLVSGEQIRRLCFEVSSSSHADGQRARRTLLRLVRLGLLARLERRIGGKKFGSDGFCYRLAADGQRLIEWWRNGTLDPRRLRPEPGERFVAHRLAVSELYVHMIEACRRTTGHELEVLGFDTEPDCWRQFEAEFGARQRTLKPDAFLKLGAGEMEHWWFCEIDRGTVSRRTRESQAAAYRSYWRSGAAGEVMPRVLWVVPNELVGAVARAAIKPSGEPHGLFAITTAEDAVRTASSSGIGARR